MGRIYLPSLRFRLMVLVLLAVVPALALVLYSAAEQQKVAIQEAQDEALRLSSLIAAEQERMLTGTHQFLSSIAALLYQLNPNPEDCTAILDGLRSRNNQYLNLALIDSRGNLICSADPIENPSFVSDPLFQRTTRSQQLSVGQYQLDSSTGLPIVEFQLPIIGANHRLISVLYASMDAGWFGQVASQAHLPDSLSVTLFDGNGTVLVRYPTPEDWIGQSLSGSNLLGLALHGDGSAEIPDLDGELRLFTLTTIEGTSNSTFYLAVGVSRQAAVAEAHQALIRNLTWLGLVGILALAAAWLGSDLFILNPIRSLLTAARGLMAGNLQVRTGLPSGSGELSELARVFDQMAEILEQREAATRRQNRNLSTLNSLTASVGATLELDEVLANLRDHLADQLEIPGGLVFVFEETKAALFLRSTWGVSGSLQEKIVKIPASTPPYAQIIQQKEPLSICDLYEQGTYRQWGLESDHPEWRYSLCVPLLAKGETQGLFQLFSPVEEIVAPDQIALMSTIGKQVGVVIQNARLFEQIRTGRERLRILSQRFLEVQEAERRHIARELHDQIGQALTALKVNLQSMQRSTGDAPDPSELQESILMIDRTIQQVRGLSLDLRPSLLDDLGVISTIRWYVDRQARRAGFEAELTAEPPEMRLSPELETTCFRLVQEAITNVVRHAQASRVEIDLRQHPNGLALTIRDDGIGFNVRAARERGTTDASLGLLGMEERVQLVGGQIEILSNVDDGTGTEIRVWFPIQEEAPASQHVRRREIG